VIRTPNPRRERATLYHDHVAVVDGDQEDKIFKPHRACVILSARYVNPTGLADDADDYFDVTLMNGADEVTTPWSTSTDAIPADTFIDLELALPTLDAGDVLSWKMDGTVATSVTLPAGRLILEVEYL
jgi:hypothetical protein